MFENAAQFSMHIDEMAANGKMSHMDAILKYCADNYIEPEDIKSLVNKTLKDKIAINMQDANLLPKKAGLDV